MRSHIIYIITNTTKFVSFYRQKSTISNMFKQLNNYVYYLILIKMQNKLIYHLTRSDLFMSCLQTPYCINVVNMTQIMNTRSHTAKGFFLYCPFPLVSNNQSPRKKIFLGIT